MGIYDGEAGMKALAKAVTESIDRLAAAIEKKQAPPIIIQIDADMAPEKMRLFLKMAKEQYGA